MKEDKKGMWLVLLAIVFILGGIGLEEVSQKCAEQRTLAKEKAQEEYQRELDEKVVNMLSDYAFGLEKILRGNGIEDADVVWSQCTPEEYVELFGALPPYCNYFFKMDYLSDEIATICEEYILQDKKLELLKLLKKCVEDKQSYLNVDEDRVVVFYSEGTSTNLCINDGIPSKHLVFKTKDGQEYRIEETENKTLIYKDTELLASALNSELDFEEENASSGSHNTPSKPSSNNGIDKMYDPYGVEDYNNPYSFADEWAEEFGEGNYEDGYDDAYDYWEEEYGR